jgi:7-cyano-7-deazaguanine reductase
MKKHNGENNLLGRITKYPKIYSPEILVTIPRSENRERYGIKSPSDIFGGYDVWHAYEAGFLTQKGLPVTGLLKIVYPSDSRFIVESKSLKLYLNSFNMSKYGTTRENGIAEFCRIIENDLSKLLTTKVLVNFISKFPDEIGNDFEGFKVLEESINIEELEFKEFDESPSLLIPGKNSGEIKFVSHLLRSNCKVTHQPDWGSVFIFMEGDVLPRPDSLLSYLVSFRNENHFHEEICEMIYKRLWDMFSPDNLMVTGIYTRGGGSDICPSRASNSTLLPKALCSADKTATRLLRQ